MKASELIERLQTAITNNGDLELFSEECYAITGIGLEEGGEYPAQYNMPEVFFMVKDYR